MSTIKNRIKVYARLKKEPKYTKLLVHNILKEEEYGILFFSKDKESKLNQNFRFRFDRVFTVLSEQSEVFDTIAKPVINGMFNGFNGTIFAYGQTGSGKTYALTGSQFKFAHRGLIPRTIEYIFNNSHQKKTFFEVSISYLEIYNEVAYDLLNTKDNASTLEELPRIVLLEDNKGEAHYKNLTIKVVNSEHQAMQLLYLGDTNRTIAETPLNEYSSRSHCIFTIYLVTKHQDNGNIRKAKLNLVDLAGSERLHKINLDGVTLSEAKSINLSLHYLEQVILALSESKRPHIPFRNSIMTFMLRDSIAGNCTTAMLATLSLSKDNYEETLTTCKFAQRVSLIKNDICFNEEVDKQHQITLLQNEIQDLKKKLDLCCNGNGELSKKDEDDCKKAVKKFLYSNIDLPFTEIHKIKYCASLLRGEIRKKDKNKTKTVLKLTSEAESKYKELLKQKNTEISLLMKTLESKKLPNDKLKEVSNTTTITDKDTFKKYISNHENITELNYFSQALQENHKQAQELSHSISKSKSKIIEIKKSLSAYSDITHIPKYKKYFLNSEQEVYRELLDKMETLKKDSENLKRGMSELKSKIIEDFKLWKKIDSPLTPKSKFTLEKKDSWRGVEYDSSLTINKNANERVEMFDINKKLDELFNINNYENQNDDFQKVSLGKNVDSFGHKNAGDCFDSHNYDINCPINEKLDGLSNTNYYEITQDKFRRETPRSPPNIGVNRLNLNQHDFFKTIDGRNAGHSFNFNCNKYKPEINETKEIFSINNDLSAKTYCNPHVAKNPPGKEVDDIMNQALRSLIKETDGREFIDFIKDVPLTGDIEVDEEIVKFYRIRFINNKII